MQFAFQLSLSIALTHVWHCGYPIAEDFPDYPDNQSDQKNRLSWYDTDQGVMMAPGTIQYRPLGERELPDVVKA